MTLDEAIKRFNNNAEYERTHGSLQGCLEFRQLAEWLTELKKLKEQTEQNAYKEGYDACKRIMAKEKQFNSYCPKCMGKYQDYNKEKKRMSDLIKRSAALKPYEGLGDDDLISVKTIRENLEHVQTVDFEDEGKCSTCKHDFGRENCGSCKWDSVTHTNTNWEPRVLEGK